MKLGRVISSEFAVNRDGENPVLLLQVELSDPDDIQTVEYLQAAGVDYRPPADTSVIVLGIGTAWQIAIAADDGVEKTSLEGEYEIYANNGGSKGGRLKCKPDGTVQAGDGDDYVAQAGKVDQFISDVVNLLTGWTVAPNDGGAALQTAASLLWSTPPGSVASSNLKGDD